ncbi:MAG: hypothetical protein LC437_09085, partial [Thiohalomonas sp.]|nr:hypothetical protein [Thiohalomonas sp.]
GCESNLRHWIILIFFSMKIKHFHRSWVYAGKLHIEWDSNGKVPPMGQLAFFIPFLKLGDRFDPWVSDCPLHYRSNNAPKKVNVLGSLFLSILPGHNRYAHITNLMSDQVNS